MNGSSGNTARLFRIPMPCRIALWAALAALTACGFQLRGERDVRLPDSVSPLHIEGVRPTDSLYKDLARALRETGVGIADDPAPAASRLRLSLRESRTRVLAVDQRGKAVEYEVLEAVSFELTGPDRNVLVPQQRVVSDRPFTVPPGTVLGKAEEEELLRRTARRDIIDQMLRRLRAQLR